VLYLRFAKELPDWGFFVMFSVVLLLVDYLCRLIIRRRLRIPGSLVITSWIGYVMGTYLCAVIVFGLRLLESPVYKHNVPQPPPKAEAI